MDEMAGMNYPQACDAQVIGKRRPDVTLRQNIDAQIEAAEKRVQQLKEVKARLEATQIIDSRIDDLQQAMRW